MMMRLTQASDWLLSRDGWQRYFFLFVAGALTALVFAPFHLWPVLFLTFPYLLLQLTSASPRQAAWRCFFFGYGLCAAGTYWIAFSLLVDAEQFAWLVPFCILGISAAFACYFWGMGWLFAAYKTSNRVANVVWFATLWVGFEYLRSIGILGFPWNLMGYVVVPSERLSQLASLIGTFGLSWFVVFSAFPLICRQRNYLACILILVIAAYGYGMWRVPEWPSAVTQTRIRVVQPNIPQEMKWTETGKDESMRVHGVLTHMQTDAPPPDIVIWSETAFPFTVFDGSGWFERTRHFAPKGGYFITGAVRKHREHVWNSMFIVNDAGEKMDTYDKHHLVPFGEFVPLRAWLPLEKITPGMVDFSRGEGVRTLTLKNAPAFSPLICYEVVFPWLAARNDVRPEWMLNLTNDAWYGDSPGPYQHFAMTRMRAIEQGLPMVRVANTGISAMIDPYGRIVGKLPLNERGLIDKALPQALQPTLYARLGEIPMLFALAACAVAYLRYRKSLQN